MALSRLFTREMKITSVLLLLLVVSLVDGATYPESLSKLSKQNEVKIQILETRVHQNCLNYKRPSVRELDEEITPITLEVQRILIGKLEATLLYCPKLSSSTRSTITTSISTTTTTKRPTTTRYKQTTRATTKRPKRITTKPSRRLTTTVKASPTIRRECQIAKNYNQHWRANHNTTYYKPYKLGGMKSEKGYACDLYKGSPWFRITGDAGMFDD